VIRIDCVHRRIEPVELLEAGHASGEVDETMLEALEDYVKRQKKRLSARPTIDSPKARAEMRAFMKDDDEEAANLRRPFT
jgi:hypothetical protein